MSEAVPTSENSTDRSGVASLGHLLTMFKENPIPVMLGILIAQQMGWLATATSQISGVCF